MLINFWPWLLYDIDFTTPFIVFSSVSKKLFKIFFINFILVLRVIQICHNFLTLTFSMALTFLWSDINSLISCLCIDLWISCIYSVLILSKASFSKVYMDWYSALCYLCFSLIVSRREGYYLTGRLQFGTRPGRWDKTIFICFSVNNRC